MADSDTEITKEELQKEIAEILENASLDKTSTKKVIQKLEQKLGVDLTEKKKLIDQLVMDYVNSIDSDEELEEESEVEDEPPKKKPTVRKAMKQDDDEDEDEHDDSNDSDWGCHHHHRHHLDENLLHGYSDESCHLSHPPQESNVTTTGIQSLPRLPKKKFILRRVTPMRENEADIFGKLIAKKLQKLADQQRDSIMLEINKLFFNKCYKPASPPKRKMEDKATSTLPIIQCDVKEIFRITGRPTTVNNMPAVATPITVADFSLPIETLVRMPKPVPKTDVPPSNVPEPVVQEAATPKPHSNENTGHICGLM